MKRKFTSLLILIIIFVSGCSEKLDKKQIIETNSIHRIKTTTTNDYSAIKLIDRFNNKLEKDTVFKKTEAQFSPIYIGEKRDEISLTYKTEKIGNRIEEWDRYKTPSVGEIEITIDTSRTVGSPMGIWEYYKKPEYRNEKIAFPVFIENISNDTLNIGFGDIIPMIIEAKDKEEKWRPIQREFIYDCGTGLTEFYLSPKQIAVTTMKIFVGNFETKLRLVFDSPDEKIYSNEIDGRINPEQFE
jgi:hypothetical protein